ncbi:MAG: ribonuclease HII [Janthinobacterium sp.]|jgi:ribonuclease HII
MAGMPINSTESAALKQKKEHVNKTIEDWADGLAIAADDIICGVDEAGRGPLAGPVFAGAVILDPARPIAGLRDSKKLSEAQRDALAIVIKRDALCWAVAECSEAEIDQHNILQASMLAMRRAVETLVLAPTLALIDGNRCPEMATRAIAIVKGDDKVDAISAASILAKTARDAAMVALHQTYPQYGFDQHKGYPTKLHVARLQEHGVSSVHRRSYAPVRKLLETDQSKTKGSDTRSGGTVA